MTRAEDVDAHFVARQRLQRAGWSAIARMTGCPERDLRRRFDLGFAVAEAAVGGAAAPSSRDRVAAAVRRAGLTADQSRLLARLWAANGSPLSNADLSRGVCHSTVIGDLIRELRREAKRLGVEFARAGRWTALTPGSIVVLSDLAGLREAA